MSRFMIITIFSLLPLCVSPSWAANTQMRESLVPIIHALHAMKPLIQKAQEAQSKNPRIKVHFTRWRDNKGRPHNGLKEDITMIEKALIDIINKKELTPRYVAPIESDYVS